MVHRALQRVQRWDVRHSLRHFWRSDRQSKLWKKWACEKDHVPCLHAEQKKWEVLSQGDGAIDCAFLWDPILRPVWWPDKAGLPRTLHKHQLGKSVHGVCWKVVKPPRLNVLPRINWKTLTGHLCQSQLPEVETDPYGALRCYVWVCGDQGVTVLWSI